MGPNSLEYQKSIALEFNATKDRIRYLIGSTHWGEDGRHKEVILMNFLKRFLPNNIEVGTGFIKDGDNISTQIDIIVYNPSLPLYFKENDFVIVQPKSVLGIIEVKSNPDRNKIAEAIFKASKAVELIQDDSIFNGLFIFGNANNNQNHSSKILKKPKDGEFKKSLLDALSKDNGIDHIVSNDGAFIKKWNEEGKFSCYAIKDLAASYFFSNLLDIINNRNELLGIPEAMYDHLYPIPEGKETFIKWKVEQQIEEPTLNEQIAHISREV
ncbi:hypothetical protein ELQ35_15725 [Peribacillus cavernae]|uniref:DUF6602 domain-containing protein n=1 Tax=Peribacillus cavernae TaxID=1674310 RepID=A0A3S0V990_9BACI|nr:DUF6602 domain-containing protein [Peribacillus cavernae]MDQ0221434.1 hypothetical protein [Peribacillus cavernae]RUQ27442.1 hypothetical protein ELQ35_15725 [Peribacillus cavernae]